MGIFRTIDNVTFGFLKGIRNIAKAFASIFGAFLVRTIVYSLIFLLPLLLIFYAVERPNDEIEIVGVIVLVLNALIALVRSITNRRSDPDMSEVISDISDAVEGEG